MSDDVSRNPTPEELERILRPGLPSPGPVERFATWGGDIVARGENVVLFPKERTDNVHFWPAVTAEEFPYGAPTVYGTIRVSNYVEPGTFYVVSPADLTRTAEILGNAREWERYYHARSVARGYAIWRRMLGARPLPEIRARAATSRYWAQRLRWLRKRGRA